MFLNDIASFYNEYDIPDYCRGTIQKGEIFFLVNTKSDANNFIYELELRKIVHEYIHILYAEYIANINEDDVNFLGVLNVDFEREGYCKNVYKNGDIYLGYYSNNKRDKHGLYQFKSEIIDDEKLTEFYFLE